MQAVILAGGRGTRMGRLTHSCPKPLLPVGGEPLVAHQLRRLARAGVGRVVLSVGYRADDFAALGDGTDFGIEVVLAVEQKPLGTAGGLAWAATFLDLRDDQPVIVLNGDLISGHDLLAQANALTHPRDGRPAVAALHVRRVPDARPYGLVDIDETDRVRAFREKPTAPGPGLINAGTYVLTTDAVGSLPVLHRSLEQDVFPSWAADGHVLAHIEEAYFLDVGTPEALTQANVDAHARLLP